MHIGNNTICRPVSINGCNLPVFSSCRDLGVLVSSDLSPSVHIDSIVAKAHQRANVILRCFLSRDVTLLTRAFTVYVRPILEYNCVVWSPHLKQDIEKIERVQRRYTKRLCGLSNISYSERLRRLQLCSLEQRRLHFDLLMCYRIIFGLVKCVYLISSRYTVHLRLSVIHSNCTKNVATAVSVHHTSVFVLLTCGIVFQLIVLTFLLLLPLNRQLNRLICQFLFGYDN